MSDAVKFWLAKELVTVGLFVAAFLVLFAFAFVATWREGRRKRKAKEVGR